MLIPPVKKQFSLLFTADMPYLFLLRFTLQPVQPYGAAFDFANMSIPPQHAGEHDRH